MPLGHTTTTTTTNNNNNNNTSHHQAMELVLQEIGRRTANIAGDARESTFLFQHLSVALQRGNAVSFQNTFTAS